jgi:gluconolactonase
MAVDDAKPLVEHLPCVSSNGTVSFSDIVDPSEVATAMVLAESSSQLFHEAGVWIPLTQEWVVTSNRLSSSDSVDDETGDISKEPLKQRVIVSAIGVNGGSRSLDTLEELGLIMGNGGTSDGKGGAYICSQGLGTRGGSIWHIHGTSTLDTPELVVKSAPLKYLTKDSPIGIVKRDMGLDFNSPNDVVLYKKKWLLFTDPTYGYEQSFRTTRHLDGNIWYASVASSNTPGSYPFPFCCCLKGEHEQNRTQIVGALIVDGLVKPNGICISPDDTTLYVTDTGYVSGNGEVDDMRPRHVLAYDIHLGRSKEAGHTEMVPIVANPRVIIEFTEDAKGVPDGIKVDADGNIYIGAGDGVRVYTPDGTFLGTLGVEGGAPNLCFGGKDLKELLILNETRAIKVQMKKSGVKLT